MQYDYFRHSADINPGNIETAYRMYDWFVKLGHKTWIEKIQDPTKSATYQYRVWRIGHGYYKNDNQEECTGVIVAASHPEIAERFRNNVLAGAHKRVA